MALFSSFHNGRHDGHSPRRRLPDHEALMRLRRVQRVCQQRHAHLLPVEMIHLSETRSHRGTPMLVTACAHRGCNWREGWVIDDNTHQPSRLWAGIHRN